MVVVHREEDEADDDKNRHRKGGFSLCSLLLSIVVLLPNPDVRSYAPTQPRLLKTHRRHGVDEWMNNISTRDVDGIYPITIRGPTSFYKP